MPLNKAYELLTKGELKDALSLCEGEIKKNNFDSKAWHLSALIFKDAQKPQEAVKCFENSLKIEPQNHIFHFHFALFLAKYKNFIAAKEAFKKSILLKDDFLEARNEYADMLLHIGDSNEALKQYEKIIELDPKNIEALNNLAVLEGSNKNFDKSQKYLHKILKLNPFYASGYANLGINFLTKKEYIEALENLQKGCFLEKDSENRAKYTEQYDFILKEIEKNKNKILHSTKEKSDILKKKYFLISSKQKYQASEQTSKEQTSNIPIKIGFFWKNGYDFASNFINDEQNKQDEHKIDEIGGQIKIDLKLFSILFTQKNSIFYSLQKNIDENEKFLLRGFENVIDLGSVHHDFKETAAILDNLDLIVGVDSPLGDFCVAMDKKCFIMSLKNHQKTNSNKVVFFQKDGDWFDILLKIKNKLN